MINNNKAGGKKIAPVLKKVLILSATYLLLGFILVLGISPEQHDIQIGAPAPLDILATKDVIDTVTTDELKNAAAAAVEPSYKNVDPTVVGSVSSDMDALFNQLLALRENDPPSPEDITAEELKAINDALPITLSADQYAVLLSTDEESLKQLFNSAIISVRDTLNSSLLEGQEVSAVNRLSRTLAASGNPTALVSLITDVIRNCIRPNMLIDEEITEANRQKARDGVETVTCVKGEVIVRRGEIVTMAQYTMLSSLGLLKEDSIDLPLLAGIALVLALLMGCMALYLNRYLKSRMTPANLTLLSLIALTVTGLCFGLSRWSAYMMPLSLGLMLVAILFDQRAALYFNIAIGFIASLLSDTSSGLFSVTMFSVLLMSMVSGPIILAVFSRRTQRITTLLAGVLVGLSNFVCTFAVGLINSADLASVTTNALWAMSNGIISAILCIGLQPLLESLFNLATNTKLIELSNPNQPLLRRLLIEAPGTYHHSIIVANLAEAAAAAVGGNALLARVGAYYHDVGKLKRPVYFKENQLGDNPHDRTDPRVSVAILTAHPRDGAAMAQKARIPEPVLNIIRQHHGDSVALFFYDKAVKLYGAENVDINAFRYEGPRPRTKEAACVMLADTIEAAARSVPDPSPEKIDALIHKLVRNKLNDGQLDESDLTFSDLEKICSAFSTVLTGVFHERIEYPDVAIPPREETAASAAPAADVGPDSQPRDESDEFELMEDEPEADEAQAEAWIPEDLPASEEADADDD
ncbi:MAG: HDIG domain-containing protein [Clostridia bacterium]|nr:HDIG domain-containing protein [Clostridia bacterium]